MINSEELNNVQVARYVAGEASPEEAMQVEAWANQSKENEAYLKACFQIINSFTPQPIAANKEIIWKNIEWETSKIRVFGKKTIWKTTIAAASILLLLMVGSWMIHKYNLNRAAVSYEATSVAEKIELSDGTKILLAPQARVFLNAHYGEVRREIKLAGSAVFIVKHDPDKPFVITIGRLHIEDAGTQFNVKSTAGKRIMIEVQEGSVNAYDDDSVRLTIQKGETALYLETTGQFASIEQSSPDSTHEAGKVHSGNAVAIIKTTPITGSDTPNASIEQKPDLASSDSITNLSLADAREILGTSVIVTSRNSNKNDGLLKQIVQYRSSSDPRYNLDSEIEYFTSVDAARKQFEHNKSQVSSSIDVSDLGGPDARAFSQTDSVNIYQLQLQQRNIILQVRLNKLTGLSAIGVLQKVVKRKTRALR